MSVMNESLGESLHHEVECLRLVLRGGEGGEMEAREGDRTGHVQPLPASLPSSFLTPSWLLPFLSPRVLSSKCAQGPALSERPQG